LRSTLYGGGGDTLKAGEDIEGDTPTLSSSAPSSSTSFLGNPDNDDGGDDFNSDPRGRVGTFHSRYFIAVKTRFD
jgi:hypothetical protein